MWDRNRRGIVTRPLLRAVRHTLLFAGACCAMAAAARPSYADDAAAAQHGWSFSVQGPFGFTSGGSPGSFYFQSTPGTAFSAGNGTRGFTDYSLAHDLSLGRDLGIGDTKLTFGARVAEPLITNGFTPALESRRYIGAGPRVGLQGSNRIKPSWKLEWQVGASLLYGGNALDLSGGGASLPIVPNYNPSKSPVLNVDGLLGLSYFFDAASKLTVGYRADYLKGTPTFGALLPGSKSMLDHGPVVKFTIQK
jgi:hypothetical protein